MQALEQPPCSGHWYQSSLKVLYCPFPMLSGHIDFCCVLVLSTFLPPPIRIFTCCSLWVECSGETCLYSFGWSTWLNWGMSTEMAKVCLPRGFLRRLACQWTERGSLLLNVGHTIPAGLGWNKKLSPSPVGECLCLCCYCHGHQT